MANRAAQLHAEVLAHYPAASIVERTRGSLKHHLGGGRYAIDATAGQSLHYHDGSAWQEIETDWRDSDDPEWTDRADRSHYKVYAKTDGTRRLTPRRDVPGEYVEFGIPEYWRTQGSGDWRSLPQGVKNRSADQLSWDGTAVAISLVSTPDRLKFHALLKTVDAPTRLRWPITLVGLTLDGSQQLISTADQTVVGRLPAPTMTDAAQATRSVTMTVAGGYVEYDADVTGLTYPIDVDPTIDIGPITVGADVCREDVLGGSQTTYLGYLANDSAQYVWMGARFTGITIPGGATIASGAGDCVLTIYSLLGDPNDNIAAAIDFEDASAPAQFASTASNISGRTGTGTADVSWSNASLGTEWQNSPDLSGHVQELVDSYTYSSGVMLVRLHHTSAAGCYICYEADYTGQGPKLHIEYEAGSTVAPGAGSASLTGAAPTVTQQHAVAAVTGAATMTGLAPTVSLGQTVAPTTGTATLTGAAPTVTRQALAQPTTGSLTATGAAPTVTLQRVVTPTTGAVVLTGLAPTVAVLTADTVTPTTGTLAATGLAPTVTTQHAVATLTGTVTLIGLAPEVTVTALGQTAAPTSDVSAGTWTPSTGTDLFACVDEASAEDADYIRSGETPVADTAVLGLGSLSTPAAGTVTLRIRSRWVA